MSEDLFLKLLVKHSTARLRELRAEADEKVQQGQLERDYIDRALKAKGSADDRSAPPRPSAPRPKKGGVKPGSTREPIESLVSSDPGHIWLPSEVRNLLDDRYGINIAVGTVRATMKRLLDEGVFARPYEGGHGFVLATSNGSGGEPQEEATASAPGGSEPQGDLPASIDRSE